MRCSWCANPESIELSNNDAKEYTVEEIVAELIKDKPFYDAGGGGVTITGGEALLQPDFVCELCDALHTENISVALETSANIEPEDFLRVIRKCDVVYIDLKHYCETKHMQGTGASLALTRSNIRAAIGAGVKTVIRIPVIPGYNDSAADMEGFSAMLGELGAREVQLLPFHQMGEHKYAELDIRYDFAGVPGLREEDLEVFAEFLRERWVDVQIGG